MVSHQGAVSRKPGRGHLPGCQLDIRHQNPLSSVPQVGQGSTSPHPLQLWPEGKSWCGLLLKYAPTAHSAHLHLLCDYVFSRASCRTDVELPHHFCLTLHGCHKHPLQRQGWPAHWQGEEPGLAGHTNVRRNRSVTACPLALVVQNETLGRLTTARVLALS